MKATPATAEAIIASRWAEKGCSKAPVIPADTTMPTIIMIQVIDAAAGRRSGATRVARRAKSEVPAAPTPAPIMVKARSASRMPRTGELVIISVASVARIAPSASTPIPPIIQGVRRRPMSEP